MAIPDALYSTEKECPVCSQKSHMMKVRSRLTTVKRDTDFCTYYHGVNPYYYAVLVCRHCGYAAHENDFETTVSDKVVKFLKGREVKADFGGVRTQEQALNTYKLAIFYGEMAGIAASKLGGLYLRMGWIFRESKMQAEELAALAKAFEYYDRSTARERFPISGMSEVTLMYLLGELLRRINRGEESLHFFNRVISNPQAKMEPRILDMARDAWKDTRDLLKQQAEENHAEAK